MKLRKICVMGIFCVVGFALVSCAPRGETRTLAQILESAQSRYAASYKGGGLSADAQKGLDGMSAALKTFLQAKDAQSTGTAAAIVVDEMSQLAKSAGYTSRPAFFELLKQYEAIAAGQKKPAAGGASPQARLLAARTFNLLARELETTRFQL